MADSQEQKVSAKDLQKTIDNIDWKKFTRSVIAENSKNAEAFEKARAKSIQSAAQYVLV